MSEHFSIDELAFSQTAIRNNICNTPPDESIRNNLERVCDTLEQIRALTGQPIYISSGYRCPGLNRMVGGASASAHVQGLAADFTCKLFTPKQLALMIRDSDIEFDQLIQEGRWVHIGLSIGKPRREVLTAQFDAGHATYTKGIA